MLKADDDPQRRCVRRDLVDGIDDRGDGLAGEDLAQVAYEQAALVLAAGQAEQRERAEDDRHEREQREVGDHRRQVRAAIGEELLDQLPFADAHVLPVSPSRA
jgi:hypothetical protein